MEESCAPRTPLAARRGRPRRAPAAPESVIRVEVRLPRDVAEDIYAVAYRDRITISHAVTRVWRSLGSDGGGGM